MPHSHLLLPPIPSLSDMATSFRWIRGKGERRKRPTALAGDGGEPSHRVEHATASCPDCQVPLIGGRVCGSRQVITLPRVRARVTEHVVLERACPKCRKRCNRRR